MLQNVYYLDHHVQSALKFTKSTSQSQITSNILFDIFRKMSNTEWMNEIDNIIHKNIEGIGDIFNEIKSQASSAPIDPTIMMKQLNVSERM